MVDGAHGGVEDAYGGTSGGSKLGTIACHAGREGERRIEDVHVFLCMK